MWITSLQKDTHINNYHQQCGLQAYQNTHTLIIIINSVDYKLTEIHTLIIIINSVGLQAYQNTHTLIIIINSVDYKLTEIHTH